MNRLMESQDLLREVMTESIGIYMSKEPNPKFGDSWRDLSIWQLIQHLAHEVEEIKRSDTEDRQYHNALDSIVLAAMIAARVRLGLKKD